LADTNTFLDSVPEGGFTVFARVTGPGMVVADRIAALPRVSTGIDSALTEMPVSSLPVTIQTLRSKSVFVTHVTEFPPLAQQSEADRVFNYLEATYPQYLVPSQGQPGTALGYTYRYYAGSNAYVGIQSGRIDYLVPAIDNDIHFLANVADILTQAVQAGY
jgi:peptidyl-prolyl cis-trans isomerase A (cyclophilin A)